MMNDKKYVVYAHINKFNNKKYIGITGRPAPEDRWGNNGRSYSKSPYFYRAIQKYGWDNFEHKILIHGLTEQQAKRWEIKLIHFYKSNLQTFGYNCSLGGEHNQPSIESRKAMSERFKGHNNPRARKVICIENEKIYDCLSDLAAELGVSTHAISEECRGKRKLQRYFYMDVYEKLCDEEKQFLRNKLQEFLLKQKSITCTYRKVIDLLYSRIFNSARECSEYYGWNPNKVYGACVKGNHYRFRFLNDFQKLPEVEQLKLHIIAFNKSSPFKNKTNYKFSSKDKKIVSLIDFKVYNNVEECCTALNVSMSMILQHLRGMRKVCFFMTYDNFKCLNDEEKQKLQVDCLKYQNNKKIVKERLQKTQQNRKVHFKEQCGYAYSLNEDMYSTLKRKVIRCEDGKVYASIKECSIQNNIPERTLRNICTSSFEFKPFKFFE